MSSTHVENLVGIHLLCRESRNSYNYSLVKEILLKHPAKIEETGAIQAL